MKKINILGILTIVTIAFILSGCSGGNNTVGPSSTPFQGGVTALSMEFIEGAPPEEVYDNGQYEFGINIKMENLGEHDLKTTDGYVEITGINAKDFGLASQADLKKDLPQDMKGVKKNFQGTVLVGETAVEEFNSLNFQRDIRGNWGETQLQGGPRIRANLCYNYETQAQASTCLKKDMLTNIDTKEICELSGEKEVFNSGGPIQITRVFQTPIGSEKIQLEFEVSHVGETNDRFYKIDTACDDRSTNINKDKVWIEVEAMNGNKAKCSGLQEATADQSGGFITLYNGKPRSVICTFETIGVEGAYEQLVVAKLKYRYYQFIEKPLLVKDVSTDNEGNQ